MGTNDDGDGVLRFRPNGYADYDWELQAYHMVTLKQGYTYQIVGGGYRWNYTYGPVAIGVLDAYDDGLFAVEGLDNGLDGAFESEVYDHCKASTETGKLYISGGLVYGTSEYIGFDVQSIELIETPCGSTGGSTSSSSSSGGSTGGGTGTSITLNPDRQVDGPVSMYGRLQAGTLQSGTYKGQGRIFGSCPTWNNEPVKVRGMSLFWSMDGNATPFYSASMVDAMVKNMKIEVIRFAMSTDDTDWGGFAAGYASAPTAQKNKIDEIVKAAVKNDIYVIIDWHSHMAHTETAAATAFFGEMAQKYGKLNNVIFEIYNEPACTNHDPWGKPEDRPCAGNTTWSTIKTYATSVIAAIRKYSDNLIVVGTPSWSSDLSGPNTSPINDKNVAYTYHYYGSEHVEGSHNTTATNAIKKGRSVFVTEWGTCMANGNGTVNSTVNSGWQAWLNKYDLSAANWSASKKAESCSAFSTSSTSYGSFNGSYYYTYSGYLVKGYLASSVPEKGYTVCAGATEGSGGSTVGGNSSASTGGDTGANSSASSAPVEVEIAGAWTSDDANIISESASEVVIGKSKGDEDRSASIDVKVSKGETYTVQFKATANTDDEVVVSVRIQDTDGEKIASKLISLDGSEQKFALTFDATYTGKVTVVLRTPNTETIKVSGFKVMEGSNTPIVKNVVQKSLVSLYGNRLNVVAPKGSDVKVQIFDMMGHLVMDKALGSAVRTLVPVENLSRGNYVVKVSGKGFAPSVTRINLK